MFRVILLSECFPLIFWKLLSDLSLLDENILLMAHIKATFTRKIKCKQQIPVEALSGHLSLAESNSWMCAYLRTIVTAPVSLSLLCTVFPVAAAHIPLWSKLQESTNSCCRNLLYAPNTVCECSLIKSKATNSTAGSTFYISQNVQEKVDLQILYLSSSMKVNII